MWGGHRQDVSPSSASPGLSSMGGGTTGYCVLEEPGWAFRHRILQTLLLTGSVTGFPSLWGSGRPPEAGSAQEQREWEGDPPALGLRPALTPTRPPAQPDCSGDLTPAGEMCSRFGVTTLRPLHTQGAQRSAALRVRGVLGRPQKISTQFRPDSKEPTELAEEQSLQVPVVHQALRCQAHT